MNKKGSQTLQCDVTHVKRPKKIVLMVVVEILVVVDHLEVEVMNVMHSKKVLLLICHIFMR